MESPGLAECLFLRRGLSLIQEWLYGKLQLAIFLLIKCLQLQVFVQLFQTLEDLSST